MLKIIDKYREISKFHTILAKSCKFLTFVQTIEWTCDVLRHIFSMD